MTAWAWPMRWRLDSMRNSFDERRCTVTWDNPKERDSKSEMLTTLSGGVTDCRTCGGLGVVPDEESVQFTYIACPDCRTRP